MRLEIARLLSDGLTLELPRAVGPADRLELERGVGVRGTYASDTETIALEGVLADELDAASVLWHIGEALELQASPLVLGGVEIDAHIARGALRGRRRFAGRIAARELQGRSVGVTSAGLGLAAGTVEAAGIAWETGHGAPTEAKLARIALESFA